MTEAPAAQRGPRPRGPPYRPACTGQRRSPQVCAHEIAPLTTAWRRFALPKSHLVQELLLPLLVLFFRDETVIMKLLKLSKFLLR